MDQDARQAQAFDPATIVWQAPDGSRLSCKEKIRVLTESLHEVQQVAQDCFEDALIMGADERQARQVFAQLIAALDNPYGK